MKLDPYERFVERVNALEDQVGTWDQDRIRGHVNAWKHRVQSEGASLDDAASELFAMTREASARTLGLRHSDVQMIGGAVLHDGKIAEIVTGEGMALVATLAAALNAISGKSVFVVSTNDYLAKQNCEWVAPIYGYLGLTVGAIQSEMAPNERHPQYGCDITYGSHNEFGFDYLRDHMKWDLEDQVQKQLSYAIIDDVEPTLIEAARSPLIISTPQGRDPQLYPKVDGIARALTEGVDFEVKARERQCLLTESGLAKAERLAKMDSFYSSPDLMDWPHHIEQALRAHHVFKRDKDYVVLKNKQCGQREVTLVEESTGRQLNGRRWVDGLHEAVEAKEGVARPDESQVLGTISLPNYFRMFQKLAGMAGTAVAERARISRIYDLDVVSIPTDRAGIRQDGRNHETPKDIVEDDDAIDQPRRTIYAERQRTIARDNLRGMILEMCKQVITKAIERYTDDKDNPPDHDELRSWLVRKFGGALNLAGLETVDRKDLVAWTMERVSELFDARRAHYGEDNWERLQQYIVLETIDIRWKGYLFAMQVLKDGISLRGNALTDPKSEYKTEAYEVFEELRDAIEEQVTNLIFKVNLRT